MILWTTPYGPISDAGPGEAGPGFPLPVGPCPVPLPEPPNPNPMSVLDTYLLCADVAPVPTATVLPVGAPKTGTMVRVASLQDDQEKHIGTMNFALMGTKARNGLTSTFKKPEKSEGIVK